MPDLRKVALFTNEYPPNVYGGAGVHVEYLSRALSKMLPVEVRCFGDQRVDAPNLTVRGYPRWEETARNTDPRFVGAVDAFNRSLLMAKDNLDASVVHCHTWYTDMAASWPVSSGACPMSSPSTPSNPCAPGRSSNSAMPTTSVRGWSAPPSNRPMR